MKTGVWETRYEKLAGQFLFEFWSRGGGGGGGGGGERERLSLSNPNSKTLFYKKCKERETERDRERVKEREMVGGGGGEKWEREEERGRERVKRGFDILDDKNKTKKTLYLWLGEFSFAVTTFAVDCMGIKYQV